jgi:maleylpyruvate isomerase
MRSVTTYDLAAALAAIPTAQSRLDQTLATLTDDEAHGPSVLPGWTRGHVITHIARHGDASVRLLTGALHDAPAEQYPGGAPARNADIEAGADRPAAALAADVAATNALVNTALDAMTDVAWSRTVQFRHGPSPATRVPWARWREVEIHHADLGLDRYTIADWPAEFVAAHLPHELGKLGRRVERAVEIRGVRYGEGDPVAVDGPDYALLAWLVGRPALAAPRLTTDAPQLPPWA